MRVHLYAEPSFAPLGARLGDSLLLWELWAVALGATSCCSTAKPEPSTRPPRNGLR